MLGAVNNVIARLKAFARRRRILSSILGLVLLLLGGVWSVERVTGTSIFVRFGTLVWIPVDERAFWLPRGTRLALRSPAPVASPGNLHWREVLPGFEVGELPVRAANVEVDRLLLARIDPQRFRFAVHNDPSAQHNLDAWMKDLKPVLVVNGSYYARTGLPSTPVISDGTPLGPADYDGKHGAFVSSATGTTIEDVGGVDWRTALAGARNAMVSYPLLLAPDGSNRVPTESGWLANRSFIAEDNSHRIIIGSTEGSFFTLTRLAAFLKAAPLDLRIALNLDGGPVACQAIVAAHYRRRHCGAWEVQVKPDGSAKMLPSSPGVQSPMPIALAVYRREP